MEGAISRVYRLTSISCSKKTREPNTAISTRRRTGNMEVSTQLSLTQSNQSLKQNPQAQFGGSPHRAVSAVRLMRIDLGGAFADLLNEKGKGYGDNEMGYVERTLGFCTRELDDRDLRVVTDVVGGSICCKRYLDHLIGSLCHDGKTFRSMEPPLLQVLHELSLHLNDFVRIRTGMQIVIQAGLLKEGLCSVQDESAGLVVSVVDPQPGESIIDCCAAPGGKTLFMASRLGGGGMVSAIDINKGRLRILKETAKLHQVDNVITTIHADLRIFAEKNQVKSDKVLLDAPCSGLGVLSKRADLHWNRRLEDMEQLRNLQDELLDAASMLVKPGGVLVYSTCSIDPEENEERVAAFLLRHPEFCIDPVDRYVSPDFVTDCGFYFSNPVKHSLDGSFAARLVRSL